MRRHVQKRGRSMVQAPRPSGLILSAPQADDLVTVLKAWRLWLLGGVIGGLLGAAVFAVAPPPYRARATVNVDFHLEQAWPQNTDREQFYYLERETRKLEEIAFSDSVLALVQQEIPASSVGQLRDGKLVLSQPGNGGWHFYADDPDPSVAASLAGAWAAAFCDGVRRELAAGNASDLEAFITVDLVQAADLQPERLQTNGMYVLVGSIIGLIVSALGALFIRFQ